VPGPIYIVPGDEEDQPKKDWRDSLYSGIRRTQKWLKPRDYEDPSPPLFDQDTERLLSPLLEKAAGPAKFVDRQTLEPAPEFEKPVMKVAEKIPWLTKPSVPYTMARNLLLNPEITGRGIQLAHALEKPAPPIEMVKQAANVLVPSRAELGVGIAGGGIPFLVGAGIKGGEGILKARRLAKIAGEAEDAVKEMEVAAKAVRPESEAARSAYNAAIAGGRSSEDAVKEARRAAITSKAPEPPKPSGPEPLPPEDLGGLGKARVDPYLTTTGKVLRDAGGKRFVPKDAADFLANGFEKTIRDYERVSNKGSTGLQEPMDFIESLKGKSRISAEKGVIERLQTGASTGSAKIDGVADQIKAWLDQRFSDTTIEMARNYDAGVDNVPDALAVLDASGIKVNKREFYFPQINDRLQDVMKAYGESADKGLDEVRSLYAESGLAAPDDEKILSVLEDVRKQGLERANKTSVSVHSVAENIELARRLDLPGYIGDIRRTDYKAGELARALHGYNEQSAFRIADSRHFGPKGEKYVAAYNRIGDKDVRNFVKEYRQLLITHSGVDPMTRELGGWLSGIRAYQAANKLGTAVIPNSLQTFVTSIPKSFQGVGTAKALQNNFEALGVAAKELVRPGEAAQEAARIGAINDRMLSDLAGVHGVGVMSQLARGVMTGTGFNKFERVNNIFSAHLARLTAEDLALEIKAGGKHAEQAAFRVRKTLQTDPALAEDFIARARRSGADDLPESALDNFGYEEARNTQFRGDPTMVPLKWSTPKGKFFTQFKNFGFNYSRFVKDEIFGYGIKTGDWRPLIVWAGSGMVTGEGIRLAKQIANGRLAIEDVKEALRDDVENIVGVPAEIRMALEDEIGFGSVIAALDAMRPVAQTFGSAGGIGLAGDIAGDVTGGRPERALGSITPSLGDLGDVVSRLPNPDRWPGLVAEKLPIGPLARPLGRAIEGEEIPALSGLSDLLDKLRSRTAGPDTMSQAPSGRYTYTVR